jgi:hypothetical protein
VPALLVSRRFDGALVLVNIAEQDWPLAETLLWAEGVNLHGADFGVAVLAPGECVLAYAQPAALRDVYVPCNETGSRVPADGALLDGVIRIDGHACAGAVCVVAGETAA